jgi:asparagine synthetase B (glutamine-hydrolysing)
LKIPLIPWKQTFCNKPGNTSLNLKAICIFVSTGFFLGKDTYFNNQEALQPATEYEFDENNFIKTSKKYWNWNYSPRNITLKQSTEEFAHLLEDLTQKKLKDKNIILPLSGGLDSRTQAAAISENIKAKSYSYKFSGSFDETKYGKEISEIKSFPFTEYIIPRGYLWKVIDKLAEINKCYADFINPRQMAVIDEIRKLGDIFYLGHWGDVLFDDTGVDDILTN